MSGLNRLSATAAARKLAAREITAEALLADTAWISQQAAAIREQRSRVGDALAELPGTSVYPTQTNFVLVRVPDANRVFEGLKARRILVKNVQGWHPLLANCLRITIGTSEENDALLSALASLVASS